VAGLSNPTAYEVIDEFVAVLPALRQLRQEFMENQGGRTDAEDACLNERDTKNYYATVDAYESFLRRHGHRAKFLSVIILVLLVFPTNAAGVERVFSAISWLKDALSNRMLDRTLNASLHVKFNDCEIEDYSLL